MLVLLTGGCLAAGGLHAAENSTPNSPSQPVVNKAANPAHGRGASAESKTAGTPHSSSSRTATPHSTVHHSSTAHTTTHGSPGTASTRTPGHSKSYSSQHKSASARYRYSRPPSYQVRFNRLHLEPERVQEIQQALIREGYYKGEASGQWDPQTRDAMLRYQTDHGFPATGLPEAKSLMKLGLGSHPLPAELDHGMVGATAPATPAPAAGQVTPSPPLPPVSQAVPPS